jgi:hypothetical protein
MGIEAVQQRPERMTLANVETGDSITAQFNPDEVKEELVVNYERLEILGGSFQPLQYKSTSNLQLNYELAFDGISARDVSASNLEPSGGDNTGPAAIMGARNFLYHLCYPRQGAQDVTGGGPPRTYMYWPELYAFSCRITKLTITQKRWARSMKPVLFTAQVTVEQVSDGRIFSEDVLVKGTLRGT